MKNLIKILVLSLCMIVAASYAYAGQGNGGGGWGIRAGSPGANFVDEDGDGVCDNTDNLMGKGRVRNGKGKGKVFGNHFRQGPRDGRGKAAGRGLRDGSGPNFVDENGDGVCDNLK